MSAYVVSHSTINALVTWANRNCTSHRPAFADPQQIGQTLWDENRRSVANRYRETADKARFVWHPSTAVACSPVQILKLVKCLDYQSCETSDWETTQAAAHLRAIEADAILALPGYDGAEWGLDEIPQPAARLRRVK